MSVKNGKFLIKIETYWNVNPNQPKMIRQLAQIKIETQWNVNSNNLDTSLF